MTCWPGGQIFWAKLAFGARNGVWTGGLVRGLVISDPQTQISPDSLALVFGARALKFDTAIVLDGAFKRGGCVPRGFPVGCRAIPPKPALAAHFALSTSSFRFQP
jgi:hypothetical protein